MATKTRSIRLDPAVWDALDERAQAMRLNGSVVIAALVQHWLATKVAAGFAIPIKSLIISRV